MPDTRHSKASVSSLAAEVNVQGEFVTLATLREMLQMQERMFKSFFDSIVTNVNTRLDSLTHSVAKLKARIASSEKETGDLKNSLEFLQKDIDDLKPSLLKLQELDSAIEEIQDDLDHQEEQMEYLENQSRRNNVRVDGISEEDNETWEETEAKVKQVLKDELNLASAPDIERAHRVGKSSRRQLRPRILQVVLEQLFVAFETGKRGKRSWNVPEELNPTIYLWKKTYLQQPLRKEKVNVQRWKQPREQGRSLILC